MIRLITGKKKWQRYIPWLLMSPVLLVNNASAETVRSQVAVNVSVTVTEAASCQLNDNRAIEIAFGDMPINRIDGHDYQKRSLGYGLSCNKPIPLRLEITGSAASDNGQQLKTSIAGLNMKFFANGNSLSLNSSLKFNYPFNPELEVVPIISPGGVSRSGMFSTTAIIKISYE